MRHRPTPLVQAALAAVVLVVLQALLVSWFAWPAQKTAPRDLPVVVAGPAPAARAVVDRLTAERPGAFRIANVADSAAADDALRERRAYAAFVLDASGMSVHVASAAGPTVATLFSQAAQQLGGGRPVPIVDVVPAPSADPRGAGFASGFLPLVLTSLAFGVVLVFAAGSAVVRIVGLIAFALLAGLVSTAVQQSLGILTGRYLVVAGVIALLAFAISASVTGLGAVLGRAGVGLGALLIFVISNPISGLASAPELLPKPWGTVGQLLPSGAGATAMRSVAFFDGARANAPLWTLAGWAVLGLVLTAIGRYRTGASTRPLPAEQGSTPASVQQLTSVNTS